MLPASGPICGCLTMHFTHALRSLSSTLVRSGSLSSAFSTDPRVSIASNSTLCVHCHHTVYSAKRHKQQNRADTLQRYTRYIHTRLRQHPGVLSVFDVAHCVCVSKRLYIRNEDQQTTCAAQNIGSRWIHHIIPNSQLLNIPQQYHTREFMCHIETEPLAN